MLDARARTLLTPTLDRVGAHIADAGVPALVLTASGWLAGIAACVAVVSHAWTAALLLWLLNRLLDGLDGPVARRRGATDLGGFLDIVADFSVYGAFVFAVAIAEPQARLACVALLTAYYVSGTAFLALSSMSARRGLVGDDGRSLRFVGGLAEGAETIVVYVVICLIPGQAALIAWIFTVAVAVTAVQRVYIGIAALRKPSPDEEASAPEDASATGSRS